VKQGEANYKSPDGDIFQGLFESNIKSGPGLIVFRKHPVFFAYSGDFQKDLMKG
jgi:hypothetical protein